MPLKVVWVFGGGVAAGWTETFWLQTGSLAGLQGIVNRFVTARSACLGIGTSILGARVTDPDQLGAAAWYPVRGINVAVAQPPLNQDTPQAAILVRFQDSLNIYRRMFEMTGVPDDWIAWNVATRQYLLLDAATTAIAAFGTRLTTDGWSLRVTNRQAAAVNLRPVQGVAYAAGVVTITSANHGFAMGDLVRISQVRGSAVQVTRGNHQITTVTANTFTYNTLVEPILPVVWVRGGLIRRQQVTFATIGETQILRASNRKRGRAFFVQRGRRPAR